MARNVFVADSTEEARRLAKGNSLGKCIQYILDLTRATAPTGVAMWKRDASKPTRTARSDYFMDNVIIAGDPAACHPATARAARTDRPVRHAGADGSRLGRSQAVD